MNEPYILEIIRQGSIVIDNKEYKIEKAFDGCRCCYFKRFPNFSKCTNTIAQKICCSAGGRILTEIKD